jgi:hypothetical protein
MMTRTLSLLAAGFAIAMAVAPANAANVKNSTKTSESVLRAKMPYLFPDATKELLYRKVFSAEMQLVVKRSGRLSTTGNLTR